MSEPRGTDLLERAFPPPADAFAGLERYRRRQQRRRRAAAVGIAIVVGGAVLIATLVTAGIRSRGPIPAGTPIGPDTVADLKLAWSGTEDSGGATSPVVADDRVYMVGNGQVWAFATACGDASGECPPIWTARIDTPRKAGLIYWWGSPAVDGDRVYVGSAKGALLGFSTSCSADCRPEWLAHTGGALTTADPVVSDGVVYVGSGVGDGKIYAFSTRCSTYPLPCRPLWTAPLSGGFLGGMPVVSNGVVYVGSSDGTIYAFPTSCARSGGTCRPLWKRSTPGITSMYSSVTPTPLVARDGVIYMASGSDIFAFSEDCPDPDGTCRPLWVAHTIPEGINSFEVGDGFLYTTSWRSGRLTVFSTACPASGASCPPLATLEDQKYSDPGLVNGVLYIWDDRGLEGYAPDCWTRGTSCAPLWSFRTLGFGGNDSRMAGDTLFAADDQRLYAFDFAGGAPSLATPAPKSEGATSPSRGWVYPLFYLALAGVGTLAWIRRRRGQRAQDDPPALPSS
jgi:outer membrane protein assembly factor BamB